jgi:hypothetical protein
MTLGCKHYWGIHVIERVIFFKQQVKILGRFAQEEALHSISLLTTNHIAEVCPSTRRPAPASDVTESHFANVQVERIFRGLVDIVRRLNELWSSSPVSEVGVDEGVVRVPAFR